MLWRGAVLSSIGTGLDALPANRKSVHVLVLGTGVEVGVANLVSCRLIAIPKARGDASKTRPLSVCLCVDIRSHGERLFLALFVDRCLHSLSAPGGCLAHLRVVDLPARPWLSVRRLERHA